MDVSDRLMKSILTVNAVFIALVAVLTLPKLSGFPVHTIVQLSALYMCGLSDDEKCGVLSVHRAD